MYMFPLVSRAKLIATVTKLHVEAAGARVSSITFDPIIFHLAGQ
jgi:hypothetical protein